MSAVGASIARPVLGSRKLALRMAYAVVATARLYPAQQMDKIAALTRFINSYGREKKHADACLFHMVCSAKFNSTVLIFEFSYSSLYHLFKLTVFCPALIFGNVSELL